MFASIRRHQKWLWIVISVLTIISFVAFFSPSTQFGGSPSVGGVGSDVIGTIYGRPLVREDYFQAAREARLRYFLSYRQWPSDDEMARQLGIVERETRNRLVLIEKLRQLDVRVGEEAVAQWIADVFKDPATQRFNKDFYDQFVRQTLPTQIGMRPPDFERFVRHEVGVQHLISVLGMAGRLVTPQEAEAVYRRENEQADTKVVFISSANYISQVNLDPSAIATYYTNQQAAYRIPERVQVSYVVFDATNYLAAAEQKLLQDTNRVNQTIEAVYQQRGTDFYKGPTGEPLPPDEAKGRIREELQKETALIEAQKAATEFMEKLFDLKPVSLDNLDKLAAATGHQVSISAPFSEFEGVPGLPVPPDVGRTAFRLTMEEPYFEQPVVSEDAVYVFSLKGRHPSSQPPLEQVQDRVRADYERSQSRILANSAGEEIQRKLSAALAEGKTFEAAAAEAMVEITDLPPFSQKTTSLPELLGRADVGSIKNVAFALSPGELSSYNPSRDGGFILYLEKTIPVSDEQVATGLPDQLKTMRQSRQYEAFADWLRAEVEAAKLVLPGDNQTASVQ